MSVVKNVSRLALLSARQITTSAPKMEVHPGYLRLKEIQKKYQLDDGKPVHLKRPGDAALMYFTFFLCGIGLCGSFKLFYDLS